MQSWPGKQTVKDPQLRRGERKDESWLFQLFKTTMQDYIDAAWGWEELLQKEGFITSLPAPNFQILHLGDSNIGCIYLSDRDHHLVLDMILVEPDKQKRGHGSRLMDWAKTKAVASWRPIRLSVLKTNPAVQFHLRHGFKTVEEDPHSLKMQWSPSQLVG